jgi:magnesium-transporting ATPase (P-type)
MTRPPRPKAEPLLTRALLLRIGLAGGMTAGAALALMVWHAGGDDHARWLAFNALVFGQLVRAYANRSLTNPIRRLPPNRVLLIACLVAGTVQLLIPFVPPLAEAFRATPLDGLDLALVAVVALVPAFVAEAVRSRRRTTWVA